MPSDTDSDSASAGRNGRRKKRRSEHPLHSKGGQFGAMYDLYRDIEAIIVKSISRLPETPATNYTKRENLYYELFQQLLQVVPDLRQQIQERGADGLTWFAGELEEGRASLRNVINHGVKSEILGWHDFGVSAAVGKVKVQRGYVHEEFGRLICPHTLDWNDPATKTGLRGLDPKYHTPVKAFSSFLWPGGIIDRTNYSIGFGRGELPIQTAIYILYGPNAANAMVKQDNEPAPGGRGSHKPRAMKWRIWKTTPGLIATCAVFVHFALSSQESMTAGGECGKFPYRKLHQALVDFVRGMPEAERTALLAFWDQRVFNSTGGYAASDDSDDDDGEGATSITEMLTQFYGSGSTCQP